jgi:hypothetical protein
VKKEQTLRKIIEKALKNGFRKNWGTAHQTVDAVMESCRQKGSELGAIRAPELWWCLYESIIFSHDFAKAFWGKEIVCDACGDKGCYETSDIFPEGGIPCWKFHLQEMALEKDRIKYLKQFI